MAGAARQFAIITGASTGIGFDLAHECAEHGFDLLLAADEPEIAGAAEMLRHRGTEVTAIEADLAGKAGVEKLYALLANAGRGLGRAFLDQDPHEWMRVVETNISGTLLLVQRVARDMLRAGSGRILITGSIAGFMPGTYQAVYNGSKAFLDSFSFALRHELKDSGVSVTCLMPGATETDFFERADMMDTKIGQQKKDDPRMVAKAGFDAMMAGKGEVITGWQNKLRAAIAHVMPADRLAEMHRGMAQPQR
jgi:short-subunit dehydrogenase